VTYPDIRFHSPASLDAALKLLGELGNSRILGGGTDLLIELKEGLIDADNLISLQDIEELKGIRESGGRVEIGAMTTAAELAADTLIHRHNPALSEAARGLGSPQIRAGATIGGNISSAVPSADLPAPLIAAEAEIRLAGPAGLRKLPLADFFSGPRATVRRKEEILAAVTFPLPPPETGISFKRFSLRASNSLAVAAAAARLTLEKGRIVRAAVILAGVAPTPLSALEAADLLEGKEPSLSLFSEAASLAKNQCEPISDVRGSAAFRRDVIEVLVRRALSEAAVLARGRDQERSRSG
jgi:CO/xanthine dehydrogenase FAD-binding subunit